MDNNTQQSVRVMADFVLVKQVMRAKKSAILLDSAKDERAKFDYYFEVVQKGKDCVRDFEVGESPIFSEYVKFSGLKILHKNEEGMVSLVIVHENDIIGIDLEAEKIELTADAKLN